jgi:GPN-loop GTPase
MNDTTISSRALLNPPANNAASSLWSGSDWSAGKVNIKFAVSFKRIKLTYICHRFIHSSHTSGKTTYCNGMQQYLKLLDRPVYVMNLDPANDVLPFDADFDIGHEVIDLPTIMDEANLGPNGGLMYCMEYLEEHADEVIAKIQNNVSTHANNNYILIDLPGQIELYTHSTCIRNLLHKLVKALDLRLTVVQLIDSVYCTDATKFLSAALLGTTTMIRLELPAINVLSKVDLLQHYDELPLQLDFFTECYELDRLVPFLDAGFAKTNNDDEELLNILEDDLDYQAALRKRRNTPFYRKHEKLHTAIAGVVGDFSLLTFLPLDISNAESVGRVLAKIDKSNGYVFTQRGTVNADMFQSAMQQTELHYNLNADVRERIASPESISELKKKTMKQNEG